MVVQLTFLLENSTPFLLAYSIPLLLLSTLITFAGTFLTLDRTRTFTPRSDVTPSLPGSFVDKKHSTKPWTFRLNGGVGGVAIGYAFGLHAATFLSLLIMNETSTASLTPTTFLITWLFSVVPMAFLGGRWRIATLLFLGISGGISLSIAISIITHPSLTSRVILAAVITPLTTIAVVIPSILPSVSQTNLAHSSIRMISSCLGAFSMTMSAALLSRSTQSYSWANAWDRLWVADGPGWGTSRERGFDALFCILWVTGALSDWGLKRWIGEDPDEKWDSYLAEYSATLPNAHNRAGNFVPLRSWWARVLARLHISSSSSARPHEMIFPTDADFSKKADYTSVPGTPIDEKPIFHLAREDLQRSVSSAAYNWEPPRTAKEAGFLRKGKRQDSGRGFKRVQESSGSDVEPGIKTFDLARRPTCLQKAKSVRTQQRQQRFAENRQRAPIEFRPKDGFSSDSDAEDSSDDEALHTPIGTPQKDVYSRSPLVRMETSATALSGTTVHGSSNSGHGLSGGDVLDTMNIDSEKARLKDMKASFGGTAVAKGPVRIAPEYSDVEEDVTTAYARRKLAPQDNTPGWKPEFLKRASSSRSSETTAIERPAAKSVSASPPRAVPMTPSLVHALGRLAKAQTDAYGISPNKDAPLTPRTPQPISPSARREHVSIVMETPVPITGLPIIDNERKMAVSGDKENWDSFWTEIQAKANETESR